MKDLASLQRAFQRHVRRPGGAMRQEILSTARAGAARRLSVYAEGYRTRLSEVLRSDYPALADLLGDAGFGKLAREYIAAHPSRFPNVRWYGAELARHLSRTPNWRRRPVLSELARFEWALGLAFDAADAPLLTGEEIAGLPPQAWPGLRLALHPSAQLLTLRGNAPTIWRAMDAGETPPAASMRDAPRTWLVWRKGYQPFYRVLPVEEAWALEAVARGRDFSAIVSGLRRIVGPQHAAQTGAQLLRNWLTEELLCGLIPPESAGRKKKPISNQPTRQT